MNRLFTFSYWDTENKRKKMPTDAVSAR